MTEIKMIASVQHDNLPDGVTVLQLSKEAADDLLKELRTYDYNYMAYRGKPMPRAKAPFLVQVEWHDLSRRASSSISRLGRSA
jgi:hypothetical protein